MTETPASPPTAPNLETILAKPVWRTTDLATILDVSPATVREIAGTSGFPRPQRHNRILWWNPTDVLNWIAAPAAGTPTKGPRRV